MSIDYATLARTPSGALTAASKRALEKEREDQQRQRFIDFARAQAFSDLEDRLIAVSEQMDAEHPTHRNEAIGGREERIRQQGYGEGVVDGKNQAIDEADGTLYGVLHEAEHRLALGLDADLPALDLIRALIVKVEGTQR